MKVPEPVGPGTASRQSVSPRRVDGNLLAAVEAAVMAREGCKEGAELRFLCPAHDDHHPSARYNTIKYVWHCDVCDVGGGALDLAKRLGIDVPSRNGARQRKAEVTRYEIRDVNGVHVATHARKGSGKDKQVWWETPGGKVSDGGIHPPDLPLYGTEKLAGTPPGAVVVLTEGEKAADALNQRGVLVVGTVTGAATIPNRDVLAVLLSFRVVLWPDNDEGGQSHMRRIAGVLAEQGRTDIRMLDWCDATPKGDAADFAGDDTALRALLDTAQVYTPPAPPDGAALLDDVRGFIRRYVVLNDAQADTGALWVLHTWALDAADSTPYLSVTSAEKRSGKTLLLEVLSLLVARPWFTGRTSAAALLRKVDKLMPTLLLDESDAAFKGEREYAEGLRGLLNAGHRRGGVATLCINKGDDFKDFSVFCSRAIAGIGKLPDTVADRAIPITLKRKARGECVERFRRREVEPDTQELGRRLQAWADAHVKRLADARPVIPVKLDDRAADGWEPLLAIADAAGGKWPGQARKAALALSVGDAREDDSLGVRLLRDVQIIFREKATDRMATADMVASLVEIEEAPWGDFRGKALDGRGLARLLRPYGVRPRKHRLGAETFRGYEREDFADPWLRYVSPVQAEQAEQAEHGTDSDTDDVPDVPDVPFPGGMQAPLLEGVL